MSTKRSSIELDAGQLTGGGLYDFLPTPDDDIVTVVKKARVEPKELPKEDRSKVIFLDVDGVLRPESEGDRVVVDGEFVPVFPRTDECEFNKVATQALRTIFQHTGASIVLSSEWRRTDIMKNSVGMMLRTLGLPQLRASTTTTLKPKPELLKANTTVAFAERRAREIGAWLKDQPDVRAWVVLDDVDLSWGDGARSKGTPLMRSRCVKTNAQICLTEQHAQLAIDILVNPPALTLEQEVGFEKRSARKLHAAYPIIKSMEKVVQEDAAYAPKPIPRRQGF
jgi:hypothetical protein